MTYEMVNTRNKFTINKKKHSLNIDQLRVNVKWMKEGAKPKIRNDPMQ